MQAVYEQERIPFVIEFLTLNPRCQIVWDKRCQVSSRDVHEYIARSAGGAIVPGEKATEQGQIFFATCRPCHDVVTINAGLEASARGFKYSLRYEVENA